MSNGHLAASHISMVLDALVPAPYTLRIIALIFRGENGQQSGFLVLPQQLRSGPGSAHPTWLP